MKRKILKGISFVLVIMILVGISSIFVDHYLFPRLSTSKFFSKYDFFKKFSEDITVINKTEQVFVKEETSIDKISNQASSSVVNIISLPKSDPSGSLRKSLIAQEPRNGTGIIVTSDGLIMTYSSALILDNANYKVITKDGKDYDAEFFGVDYYSNLCFLKINASNLSAISFGDSNDSKPGEKVVAVGNSLGVYSNRYAGGLLSSFNPTFNLAGKSLSFSDKLEGVFETDFNAGEKYVGGPIIDYSGQTIGIFGTIENNGITESFQIPSNKAKKVIERAIKKELGKDPALGIYYIPITKTYAANKNLRLDHGALIYSASSQQGLAIMTGSAGQKAGLQINDIIKAINDQEINMENSLPDLLYQFKQGDQIELAIIRNGQEIKVPVNL